MAKGNIGNLLQHFVALRVAERVVKAWAKPNEPIEYIDCYAMAPWEPICGGQPQGFVGLVRKFRSKQKDKELVSSVFFKAWEDHYLATSVPTRPQDRDYPNTAVLLRTAFPDQTWKMRLHENDSTKKGKRKDLAYWASLQTNGEYRVEDDWTKSKLICNSPAPADRPVLVMLDPFKIVGGSNSDAAEEGCLTASLLQTLVGQTGLDIVGRPQVQSAVPLVLTLFSYSDVQPDVPDAMVQKQFAGAGWSIDRARIGPWTVNGTPAWHQAWVVSTGIKAPLLGSSMQDAWDLWSKS